MGMDKRNKAMVCDGCGDCDRCDKCKTCTACETCDHQEACRDEFLDLLFTTRLPEGTTEVEFEQFSEDTGIHSMVLPDSVRLIDDYAFEHCVNMSDIHIPEGVVYIGEDAFAHCSSLMRLTLPDSLRVIGDRAFADCYRLPELAVPEGVLALGYATFEGCTGLKKLTIPGSVRKIHKEVFGYDRIKPEIIYTGTKAQWDALQWKEKEKRLSQVTFVGKDAGEERQNGLPDQEALTIEMTAPGQKNDELSGVVEIPEGTTAIERGAYMDQKKITKVILPESVEMIGDSAFEGCTKLEQITIPASVKEIGYHAFKDCKKLHELVFAGSEEQWEKLNWLEKRSYRTEIPDEEWREFSSWVRIIG